MGKIELNTVYTYSQFKLKKLWAPQKPGKCQLITNMGNCGFVIAIRWMYSYFHPSSYEWRGGGGDMVKIRGWETLRMDKMEHRYNLILSANIQSDAVRQFKICWKLTTYSDIVSNSLPLHPAWLLLVYDVEQTLMQKNENRLNAKTESEQVMISQLVRAKEEKGPQKFKIVRLLINSMHRYVI